MNLSENLFSSINNCKVGFSETMEELDRTWWGSHLSCKVIIKICCENVISLLLFQLLLLSMIVVLEKSQIYHYGRKIVTWLKKKGRIRSISVPSSCGIDRGSRTAEEGQEKRGNPPSTLLGHPSPRPPLVPRLCVLQRRQALPASTVTTVYGQRSFDQQQLRL